MWTHHRSGLEEILVQPYGRRDLDDRVLPNLGTPRSLGEN